ncbi:MAG: hypothetical protein N3B10_08375 [Armatimonadetes bacterium]|nr:hypothetical protein [Armatimonadota bacterium]MCX7968491.1 hypothetical protein [Armatimonadota bacterium]MDW8143757.1 hypothetical protein [Armatimonadota bacterium]
MPTSKLRQRANTVATYQKPSLDLNQSDREIRWLWKLEEGWDTERELEGESEKALTKRKKGGQRHGNGR